MKSNPRATSGDSVEPQVDLASQLNPATPVRLDGLHQAVQHRAVHDELVGQFVVGPEHRQYPRAKRSPPPNGAPKPRTYQVHSDIAPQHPKRLLLPLVAALQQPQLSDAQAIAALLSPATLTDVFGQIVHLHANQQLPLPAHVIHIQHGVDHSMLKHNLLEQLR